MGVSRYGASFVQTFLRESTQKLMGPIGPPSPCAQTGVKSSLGTYVLTAIATANTLRVSFWPPISNLQLGRLVALALNLDSTFFKMSL